MFDDTRVAASWGESKMKTITLGIAACAVVWAGAASAQAEGATNDAESRAVTATTVIKRCDTGRTIGRARLTERASDEGVKVVEVEIGIRAGLTEGKHAVHIHETGQCEPCSAAKGHFDPGPHGHSSPDGNHPFHAGDLVNIEITNMGGDVTLDDGTPLGSGRLRTITTRVALSDGPLSLFDEDGSALIIHVDPDSYCPGGEEAGCAGGAREACGMIVKAAG